MGNGKWKMENGKCPASENGKWEMGNGKCPASTTTGLTSNSGGEDGGIFHFPFSIIHSIRFPFFNILRKELLISFVTPFAYVVIAGMMVLSGFFFFSLLRNFNIVSARAVQVMSTMPNLNDWVVVPFYQTLEIILIFLVPLLTMKAYAEEKRSGTFEMLITSPVSVLSLVWGKFLALAIIGTTALLSSFSFCLILIASTDVEAAPVLVGFLGIILTLLGFIAISLAVASFVHNQAASGVVSLVILLMLYAADVAAQQSGNAFSVFVTYLTPSTHTMNMFRGVLQSEDVIYFVSMIAAGMFASVRAIENWRSPSA